MKFVFPISSRDIDLAKSLSELIREQGQLKAHTAHIVHPYALDTQLQGIRENLEAAFAQVEITELPVPDAIELGNTHPTVHVPYANKMFRATIMMLAEGGNTEPWYWFEADNVPLVPGFADKLLQEYRLAVGKGKPFLGSLQIPADFVRDGDIIKLVDRPSERYLVGTAIYPPDFHIQTRTWRITPDVVPFDRYNQYEIVPRATHTDSIFHNHGTQKYKVKDGFLTCATVHAPTRSQTRFELPEGTLVFHGCKDDSLINLVRKGVLPLSNNQVELELATA